MNHAHSVAWKACLLASLFQLSPHAAGKAGKKAKPSLWKSILKVSGVLATPSELRAGETDMEGDLWTVELGTLASRRIAAGRFRSPIFWGKDSLVLALRGETLLRIAMASGKVDSLFPVHGIVKLVGRDEENGNRILALISVNGSPAPHWILPGGKSWSFIGFDPALPENSVQLNSLAGWERDYGKVRLYPEKKQRQIIGGTEEVWTVVAATGNKTTDLCREETVDCGQPSLSSDRKWVVLTKRNP